MVRRYQKNKILRQWKDEDLQRAVEKVRGGELSVRAAAKHYKIPKSTLHDYIKGKTYHIFKYIIS